MSVFEEIYTSKKFYTAGGSDSSDKSHLRLTLNSVTGVIMKCFLPGIFLFHQLVKNNSKILDR